MVEFWISRAREGEGGHPHIPAPISGTTYGKVKKSLSALMLCTLNCRYLPFLKSKALELGIAIPPSPPLHRGILCKVCYSKSK